MESIELMDDNGWSIHGNNGMESKVSQRRFHCESCGIGCSTRASLAEHERRHTGEKPFSCSECHASFKRMQGLKNHIQIIHKISESRQYSCNECNKKSAQLGNIVRHILQVHRMVKRFICSLCTLKYSQSQDLKHHLASVHNVYIVNINDSEKRSITEIYVLPPVDPETHSEEIIDKVNGIAEQERKKLDGLESIISSLKVETTETSVKGSCEVETENEVIGNPINESSENQTNESVAETVSCPELWISFMLEKPTNFTSFNIGEVTFRGYVVDSHFSLPQTVTDCQIDNSENNIRNVPSEERIQPSTEENTHR
ncbi:GDNF-inducible zinc finger protein 1 [Nilaparvata lugens]|uniref:GDNF-inducible zinc finger protein 1 n=1 Tax=Nilaparvata lugens TaxID=108931 RepID=UPI00193CF811|nr:GDNF-inducible zinc finger protein 1 [Nilaparvata lugens]